MEPINISMPSLGTRPRRHSISTMSPEPEKPKPNRRRSGSFESGAQHAHQTKPNDPIIQYTLQKKNSDLSIRKLSDTVAEITSKTEEQILSVLLSTRRRWFIRKTSKAREPLTNSVHRKRVLVPLVWITTKLSPLFELIIEGFSILDEFITENKKEFEKPFSILTLVVGLVVLFYGAHFSTSIAFLAALQKGISDDFHKSLSILRYQMVEARRALSALGPRLSKKQREELDKKRVRAILATLDPGVVAKVSSGSWRGLLFAGATAKLHHAKTISLGITLGEHINRPVQRYIVPVLKDETNEDLHRWYDSFFSQVCNLIGVAIAIQISKVVGIVATSLRGAHIAINGARDAFDLVIDDEAQDLLLVLLFIFGVIIQTGITYVPIPSFLYLVVYFPMFFIENWIVAFIRWI